MTSKLALLMILFCGSHSDIEKREAEFELECIFISEGVNCCLWPDEYDLDYIRSCNGCTEEEYREIRGRILFPEYYD